MRLITLYARVLTAAIVTLTGFAACESGPTVRTHASADFQPNAYRTYGFYPAARGYTTLLTQDLQEAASRELEAHGYKRSDQPDLLVNFHVLTREKLEVTSTPTGYYGWRRGYTWGGMAYANEVRSFTEGTLNIDLVDRAQNRLVWAGAAVGQVTEKKLKDPKPVIDRAVAAILAQLPARSAQ